MMNNYIKRSALMLGAAAIIGTSAMAEEGAWRNINYQLKNPAFIPGWSGALSAVNEGVGEVYNAPFEIYQVIPDLPAGKYTLTVNAHYRYANNDLSKENMQDGKNHNAYIFLGDAKTVVEGLFDKGLALVAEGETFDAEKNAPNSLFEANIAYTAGKYVNKVEYTHPGGDLRLGIANTGGRQDEWTAFDNFKLTGPNGDVEIVNGDFSQGIANEHNPEVWDMKNAGGDAKKPDIAKDGSGAFGCYRKTNATEYGFGQQIELEAGKYRFGVQSFFRVANGNESNKWVGVKGEFAIHNTESAFDVHNAGSENPDRWPYIYVTDGWDIADDDVTPIKPYDKEGATYGKEDAFFNQTPIKCIFDEKLDVYPDNEPSSPEGTEEGYGWCDSGFEYQVAGLFVKNPEMYRNYVEFTLPAKTKVWVGMILVKRPDKASEDNGVTNNHYWHPFRDFTLEMWDAAGAGVDNVAVDNANAPVEYFNLQGIRVAQPENGISIVKQGNKVTKQVIR